MARKWSVREWTRSFSSAQEYSTEGNESEWVYPLLKNIPLGMMNVSDYYSKHAIL